MPSTILWTSLVRCLIQTMTLLGFWNAVCPTRTPWKQQSVVALFHMITLYCYHLILTVLASSNPYSSLLHLFTTPSTGILRIFNVTAFYPFELLIFTTITFIGFRNVDAPNRLWSALYAYTATQVLLLLLGWIIPDQAAPLLTVNLPLLALSLVAAWMARRFEWGVWFEKHALTLRILCGAVLLPFTVWFLLMLLATLIDAGNLGSFEIVLLIPYAMALIGMASIGIMTWIINKEQQRAKLNHTTDRMTDLNRFIDESRQNTHDFNKHIRFLRNTVHVYCDRGDTEGLVNEVDSYCEDLLERSEKDEILLQLDDPTLRAILYGRRAEAVADGILFILDATPLLPHFPVKNYELVEMIDNLMDNAFEGVLTASSERFVRVILSCDESSNGTHRHTLCVQNPCPPPDMDRLLDDRFTSKSGSHQGVGLSKVSRLIATTGGKLILGYEDGIFSAKIVYDEV